jgi:hypothetical protein
MSNSTFAHCRNCHCNEERLNIFRCSNCATIFCDTCFLPQGTKQIASQKAGYTDQADVYVCPSCKDMKQGALRLRRSLVGGGFAAWEFAGMKCLGTIAPQNNPNESVVNRKLDRISAQLNQLDQIAARNTVEATFPANLSRDLQDRLDGILYQLEVINGGTVAQTDDGSNKQNIKPMSVLHIKRVETSEQETVSVTKSSEITEASIPVLLNSANKKKTPVKDGPKEEAEG